MNIGNSESYWNKAVKVFKENRAIGENKEEKILRNEKKKSKERQTEEAETK